MKLKRKIAAGAAALLLIGSVMNVSAAEVSYRDYANTLIKNGQVELIMDVDAYKAAYSDLAKAFGNDTGAYVNHYLTKGVYEGRTKGVLFDPLVYAEAYDDVKDAYGYDISAIVQHYITFGISEDRVLGTAHGYADIAAAEKAGIQSTNVNRDINSAGSSSVDSGNNEESADSGKAGRSSGGNTSSDNTTAGNSSNNTGSSYSNSSPADNGSSSDSNDVADSSPDNTVTSAENSGAAENTDKGYDHTTSIYDNDEKTLLRVEYYDEDGKLLQYSDVTYSDGSTDSYVENIYHYDEATDTEILDRTDVYENGTLVSSTN